MYIVSWIQCITIATLSIPYPLMPLGEVVRRADTAQASMFPGLWPFSTFCVPPTPPRNTNSDCGTPKKRRCVGTLASRGNIFCSSSMRERVCGLAVCIPHRYGGCCVIVGSAFFIFCAAYCVCVGQCCGSHPFCAGRASAGRWRVWSRAAGAHADPEPGGEGSH